MPARIPDGALIEIPTGQGSGYAQFVRRIRPYGALLRVLPGVFEGQPDLNSLVQGEELFYVFFPLGAAVQRGIVRVVGRADVPLEKTGFPLMRSPAFLPGLGAPDAWFLWDGVNTWRVPWDDPRVKHASDKETVNDTLLIDRIVSGWRPSDEPLLRRS